MAVTPKVEPPLTDSHRPALGPFLAFLADDIASHPERLTTLSADVLSALGQVVADVGDIDLDAPLSPDVE